MRCKPIIVKLLLLLAWVLVPSDVVAEERLPSVVEESVSWIGIRVDEKLLINQHHSGDMACVPTSLLMALNLGPQEFQAIIPFLKGSDPPERLRALVQLATDMPSSNSPDGKVFTPKEGVHCKDVPLLVNHLLVQYGIEPLRGTFLNVEDNEMPESHLSRVHRHFVHSLTAGIPVLTMMRSFAAKRANDDAAILWEGIAAHMVLVVAVPRRIEKWQRAFPIRFADPWTGRLAEGLVRIEDVRSFNAAIVHGNSKPHWIENGFLQVDAPSVSIETAKLPWHVRSYFSLEYICGRLAKK